MGQQLQATLTFAACICFVTATAAWTLTKLWALQTAALSARAPWCARCIQLLRMATCTAFAGAILVLPMLTGHSGMGISVTIGGMAATAASKGLAAGLLYPSEVLAAHPSAFKLWKAAILDIFAPGSLVPSHSNRHAASGPKWTAAAPLKQQLHSCIIWGVCYEACCVLARLLLDTSLMSDSNGLASLATCPTDLRSCHLAVPTMLAISLSVGCAQMLQFIAGHHAMCVLITLALRVLRPGLTVWLPPPPMNAPWAAASVQDLWARWHQYFRGDLISLGARPARELILACGRFSQRRSSKPCGTCTVPADAAGKQQTAHTNQHQHLSKQWHKLARAGSVLAAFVVSGIIHEYMCFAGLGSVSGTQLLFFTVHGMAVLAEGALIKPHKAPEEASDADKGGGSKASSAGSGPKGWSMHRVAVMLFCVLTAPAFAWPWVMSDYIHQMPTPGLDTLQLVLSRLRS